VYGPRAQIVYTELNWKIWSGIPCGSIRRAKERNLMHFYDFVKTASEQQQRPGPLSGIIWVSRYQNKPLIHSPCLRVLSNILI